MEAYDVPKKSIENAKGHLRKEKPDELERLAAVKARA